MHQVNELSDKLEIKDEPSELKEKVMSDEDNIKHLKICIANLWRNQGCPYWGIKHDDYGEPIPDQKPRCLAAERFSKDVMKEGCKYYNDGCTYKHNPQDTCENPNHETNPKTL